MLTERVCKKDSHIERERVISIGKKTAIRKWRESEVLEKDSYKERIESEG